MAVAEDRRRIGTRLTVVRVAVALYFVVLVGSFWFLQVVQHTRYKEMAENNHQRLLPLRAPRGVMFDRHGRVLVENRNAFNISLLREHSTDLEGTIRTLSEITQVPEVQIREAVEHHKREPAYRPIVVITDAEFWQVAAIAARRLELPDVLVQEVPTRQYPADTLAAHLFGYVGEASEEQVSEGVFPMGTVVGQQGIEKIYNTMLSGQDGARRVMVNSMGREIQELDKTPPVEGRRVQLTIDLAMQKAAEDGFRHFGFNGAAIILEPKSGEVLTFLSEPGVRSQLLCQRHRSGDMAAVEHRQALAAAESRHPGPLLTGIDVQARCGDGRARIRSRHARLQSALQRRCGVLWPLLQMPSCRGTRVLSTCGMRSKSPATCTSTRSATC